MRWFAALVVVAAGALASPPPTTASAVCVPSVSFEGVDVPHEVTAELAALATEWVVEVRERVGDTDCRPITVTVIASMKEATSLEPPWHLPAWAAGAASPSERRIVLGVTSEGRVQDRARTLRHELVHVLVRSAAGDAPLPRWLDEGLARVLAGEHGVADMQVLAQARLGDRLLPLASLTDSFPTASADAALAYAQAGRAVSLVLRSDNDVSHLLRMVREGADVEDALRAVCGRATWQLELDVRRSIGFWAALATVGLESELAMAACGVVVAVYGVRARRRQRTRLLAMQDDSSRPWLLTSALVARWTVRRSSC